MNEPCPNATRITKGPIAYECKIECSICKGRVWTVACPVCEGCGLLRGVRCAHCNACGRIPAAA